MRHIAIALALCLIALCVETRTSHAVGCTIPPASDDVRLIGIGLHSGQRLSRVATQGQRNVTKAVDVYVAKDTPPTYVILTSHDAIIWRFMGNTEAIRQVVLSSGELNSKRYTANAVTGIPAERIRFLGCNCLPYFPSSNDGDCDRHYSPSRCYGRNSFPPCSHNKDAFAAKVEKALKRKFDGVYGEGRGDIEINAETVFFMDTNAILKTPEDLDQIEWKDFLRFTPSGIADIKPSDVVAHDAVEEYKVLPQGAGIAQLVHGGFLQRVYPDEQPVCIGQDKILTLNRHDKAYRITRDIPFYPAGLAGAHSVIFLLPEGINVPPGSPGHSCVMFEKSGRAAEMEHQCERHLKIRPENMECN